MNGHSNIITIPVVVTTGATEFQLEADVNNVVTIRARALGATNFDATFEVVNDITLRVGQPLRATREDGSAVTTAPVTSIRWADAA